MDQFQKSEGTRIKGFAPIFDSGNSMFYNISLNHLSQVRISEIKTHSFVVKEAQLLQYVHDRQIVNLKKAEKADFTVFEKDISERHARIPYLKDLYDQKLTSLSAFQAGKDIWRQHT